MDDAVDNDDSVNVEVDDNDDDDTDVDDNVVLSVVELNN